MWTWAEGVWGSWRGTRLPSLATGPVCVGRLVQGLLDAPRRACDADEAAEAQGLQVTWLARAGCTRTPASLPRNVGLGRARVQVGKVCARRRGGSRVGRTGPIVPCSAWAHSDFRPSVWEGGQWPAGSRGAGPVHPLPLHWVPRSVSTCTSVSPLAGLPLACPLAWEPLTRDRPAGLGSAGAPLLPAAARALTCGLLRFDPHSSPLGQAVFPHLTDEEAGAQRVNGPPKVTRASGVPVPPAFTACTSGRLSAWPPPPTCPPAGCLPWPDQPPGPVARAWHPGCPSRVSGQPAQAPGSRGAVARLGQRSQWL